LHARLGPHYEVSSTCYSQGGETASGQQTRPGIVANDFLPLGTWIRLDHPVFGRRSYEVLDRIGSGTELDLFDPSESACIEYGRREIGFHVINQ
jgi:3D (Asp-Asp-Asp) domain-containing protein